MIENLHLLYYKRMYEKVQGCLQGGDPELTPFAKDLKEKNESLTRNAFFTKEDYERTRKTVPDDYQSILMKTTYPGVLAGTGYAHGIGKSNQDTNMGFSLNYATGQPYIPGSSVKGMLRSCFEKKGLIKELTGTEKVEQIIDDIFEKGKDIFFDAVIKHGDKDGRFLAFDYITPHKAPTKNPVPIRMLKLLPDVVLEFRFQLEDTEGMTTLEKLNCFKTLLSIFGIGAKTRSGYGALEVIENDGGCEASWTAASSGQRSLPHVAQQPRNDTPQTTHAVSQSQNGGPGNRTFIKCPYCQTSNFKFKRDSDEIWRSWNQGICRNCKKKLW